MPNEVTTFLHPTGAPDRRPDPGSTSGWPRAVVFDCDGLLVDSSPCWLDAYRAAALAAGVRLQDVDLDALNGASISGAVRHLREEIGADVEEGLLREALHESVETRRPTALPGARALVVALAPRMPLAVASNGPGAVVASLLAQQGMSAAFAAIVSAEEVRAPKPAPDVYLEALARLGIDGSDALALEDSRLGVRAAQAAGLVVVGVPSVRGQSLEADLVVGRLDDGRLLQLLGLESLHRSTDGVNCPGASAGPTGETSRGRSAP